MNQKTACVILNYNDSKNTIELVEQVKNYHVFDHIIVVDNMSTDDSLKKFDKIKNEKVTIWQSGKNGGYGYGNNFGIKIAKEKFDCHYAVIANPDTRFSEKSVVSVLNCFYELPLCVIASPLQLLPNGKAYGMCAWKVPTAYNYIFSTLYLCKKIFFNKKLLLNEDINKVECIVGSFLCVEIKRFLEIGGYDENIFMNCEETVLGLKLKRKGYESYVLTSSYYYHFHETGSTIINIKSSIKRKKLFLKSREYVLKNYMHISGVKLFLTKIVYFISLVEEYIKMIIRLKK